MPKPAPGPRSAAALAGVVLATVAVLLLTGVAGRADVALDDLTQLAAASGAAVSCARTAWRTGGRRRQAWTAMSVGCGGWAAGQAVWSWYELALAVATPFPSPGDIGFLSFPVAATVALLLHPAPSQAPGQERRRLLDGVLVTVSILLLSWVTALGAVVQQVTDTASAAVALAYPAGDVVVLTMVVVLLSHATADRRALALVGAGVATIALADSAFLFLTSLGLYDSDLHLVGLGWSAGFVLVGLGALAAESDAVLADTAGRPGRRLTLLPYAPVVLAVGLAAGRALTGRPTGRVETALSVLVVALVLLRQYALVRDHARLLDALAVREAELRHQAFHDGLTGLDNRALFRERVAAALALRERSGQPLTVLFCDLDGFKLVNDTLGHAAGDALLVAVAGRLRGVLRAGDTLARLGGDEFAVLLGDCDDPHAVAGALVQALGTPVELDGRAQVVRMSVGATTVAAGVSPAPSVDALLAQADTAMYGAKRDGGGAVRAYGPGAAPAEGDLAGALASAVAAGGVPLVYQPVVDPTTGRVERVEALACWSHAGEPVQGDRFLALAERSGLLGALSDQVLETACAQAAAWAAAGVQPALRVAVDLPASSLADPALPERVAARLSRHGLTGSSLVLQLSRSGLLQDATTASRVCTALRRQGVLLALDGFGTAACTLSSLSDLPLDVVTLDRSLLAGVGTDPARTRLVRGLLRLGTDLGLQVVAAGVEEAEQLAALREMGMPLVQGPLVSRPQPAELVMPLLGQAVPA